MILARWLAFRLDLFGQNLTISQNQIGPRLVFHNMIQAGSVHPKPDSQPEPDWIQAGFSQYDPGCLWKNASECESGKLVAG